MGDRELRGNANISLEKKMASGTTLKVEGDSTRNSTDSPFSNFPRYYESFMRLSVHQPLFKNTFGYLDRARVKQARLDIKKFDFETADRIEREVYGVRLKYWELKFSHENLGNRRTALRKAQNFLKIAHDKLEIGLTEKPDVYAAEANVRQRVLDVLRAAHEYQSSVMALRVLLNLPELGWVIPVEEPKFEISRLDYSRELMDALARRRDLAAKETEIEALEILSRSRKNELWPDLSFEGGYVTQGLDRVLSNSQGEAFGLKHLEYTAALTLTAPLENREARGLYHQAQADVQKARRELDRLKLEIARDVDDACRSVLLAAESVRQTREIENLQRKKLEEEEQNFNRGRSDSKTIIDFQEDVIEAETEAIRALIHYEKSIETFYRATHQLLDRIAAREEPGEGPPP